MSEGSGRGFGAAIDGTLCLTLFAVCVLYVHAWPRDFYPFDEGIYLHEPVRILAGDVMYRDFFEIITPGWAYLMALLYKLFGVDMATARGAMAVLHGLVALAVFLACRRAGVRRALAALAALTPLTLAYPAVPIATAHWLATLLTMAVLLGVLSGPATGPRRGFFWGLLCGGLILVQQQKGLPITAGVGLVLLSDGARQRLAAVAAGFAAGLLLSAGLVMLGFVLVAGVEPVLEALVIQPVFHYTALHDPKRSWTIFLTMLGVPTALSETMARLSASVHELIPTSHSLFFVPLVVPIGIGVAVARRLGRGFTPWRDLRVLVLLSASGLASVAYLPDSVHFAYLTPLWMCLLALLLESAVRRFAGTTKTARAAVTAMVLVLFALAAGQLAESLRLRRALFPRRISTAFGLIDASDEGPLLHTLLVDEIHRRGARDVFFFPAAPGLYLTTGTRNPTRFEIILPGYTTPAQLQDVIASLEASKAPLVVRTRYPSVRGLEPLFAYLREHYASRGTPPKLRGDGFTLFERRRFAPPPAG